MTFRPLAFVIASLLWAVSPMGASHAAERVALVIGNANYPDAEAPLKEPVNDARAISDELKKNSFDVTLGENLTASAMRRELDRFYGKLKPGSAALLFFSGYGIQSSRQSYLIPVDAQIWTEADVRRDGLSLDGILGELNSRGAETKIAIIDASRRNPFERRFRSFSAGLAPVISPSGTLVSYSAALSSVVSDGERQQSLFVSELVKELRNPSLTAEQILNQTRIGVTRASRNDQVPWISSSLTNSFAFNPNAVPAVASAPLPREEAIEIPAQKPASSVAAAPAVSPPVAPGPPPSASPGAPAIATTAPAPVAPMAAAPSPRRDESKIVLALADDPTVRDLNNKIAAKANDGALHYRRGQVYASRGAYQHAIDDFSVAISANPQDAEALNNRCWLRMATGDLGNARQDCDTALKLRPGFVDTLDSRGLTHLKSGRYRDAITDFDAALKSNPQLTSSLYGRGLARKQSGAAAEGERDIASAKAMDPNIVAEFEQIGLR